MKQTLCYEVYAIYADYDAFAPTTCDLLFCETEEVAKDVVDVLNKNPRGHNDLAYVEGCEGWKKFAYRVVYLPNLNNVHATVEGTLEETSVDEDE